METAHHDLVFLHGSTTLGCQAVVDKYFEDYFTFQFITSGHLDLEYGERRILLKAPAVFTCYPGPRIKFHLAEHSPERWEHQHLAFRGPRVRDWISSGLFFFGEQELAQPEPIASSMKEALEIFNSDSPWSRERCVARMEMLLADLAYIRQAQRQEPWLETCIALLQPSVQPDYEKIAKACHMSLSHLRKKFKLAMGLSIHEHWLDLRVKEAGRLMGEGESNLAAVADALGYSDVSFFSRQFRQRMGVSPKVYRQSLFSG